MPVDRSNPAAAQIGAPRNDPLHPTVTSVKIVPYVLLLKKRIQRAVQGAETVPAHLLQRRHQARRRRVVHERSAAYPRAPRIDRCAGTVHRRRNHDVGCVPAERTDAGDPFLLGRHRHENRHAAVAADQRGLIQDLLCADFPSRSFRRRRARWRYRPATSAAVSSIRRTVRRTRRLRTRSPRAAPCASTGCSAETERDERRIARAPRHVHDVGGVIRDDARVRVERFLCAELRNVVHHLLRAGRGRRHPLEIDVRLQDVLPSPAVDRNDRDVRLCETNAERACANVARSACDGAPSITSATVTPAAAHAVPHGKVRRHGHRRRRETAVRSDRPRPAASVCDPRCIALVAVRATAASAPMML